MPIYSYNCEECGKFDGFRNIVDRETAECPGCKKVVKRSEEQEVNQYMAKTDYIVPDKATRRFGDDRPTPAKRARWI